MELAIRKRFHAGVLDAAQQRYGISDGAIRELDAFESFIFAFERGDGDYILRLSHSLRRTEGLIRGEIDWINTLAAGGAGVARAVPSAKGALVEAIDDGMGGQFLATAFVKAAGMKPWQAGWTPALYEAYGCLIGRLHTLTKDYRPPQPDWRRPEWNDPVFEFVESYLPPDERVARVKFATELKHLSTLPRDRDSYGLCHQDAHGGNLLVDETGRLTLFDFDDCAYNWFVNDIAICLFYTAMGEQHTPAFAEEFLTHFLRGYRQENQLARAWLAEIPHFLKVREIEMFAVIYRDFDMSSGPDAIDDEWCAEYMAGRKERIEGDVPYLEVDFARL
jgi:amicoumacin kinase